MVEQHLSSAIIAVTLASVLMDESALTGESLLVERRPGDGVRSGSVKESNFAQKDTRFRLR